MRRLSKLQKRLIGGGVLAAVFVFLAFTCQSADSETAGCPTPTAGSESAMLLDRARSEAGFNLLYPCKLPAATRLIAANVQGVKGKQQTELVFNGPYDLTVRQSQVPPAQSADPAGASKIDVQLFPNTEATLIERNDGSQKALYHLLWVRNGLYYELQAYGPPLQRRQILDAARSLEQ
jgi:hypothetical protein